MKQQKAAQLLIHVSLVKGGKFKEAGLGAERVHGIRDRIVHCPPQERAHTGLHWQPGTGTA